jgi:hypothetical protein
MMSTGRALARQWSPVEDEQLRKGVDKYGHVDMWKAIAAEFVPSRTNKACRKVGLFLFAASISTHPLFRDGCIRSHLPSKNQGGLPKRISFCWRFIKYTVLGGLS